MKEHKKSNNKYLFLGIAVLLITFGLYFLVNSIPDNSLKIESKPNNAVSTVKTGQKVKLTASQPTDKNKYAPDNKTLKSLFANSSGITLANGKKHTRALYYIYKESGGNYVYCIELGTVIGSSNSTATNSKFWNKLTSFQREAIELITVYGFPNKKRSGYTNDLQFLATQMLIWEVQQGWRTSYSSVNPKTKTLYNIVDGNEKLLKVYKDIITDVNNHKKVPSFSATSKSDTSLKTLNYVTKEDYKYSVTLSDSNKVLSDFQVSSCPTGVTCKINSNKLVLTASKEISKGYVKLTKKLPNGTTQGKLLLDASNVQKMIMGVSKDIDAIVGYVKIDNEQLGSLKIVKTSEDGVKKGFKFKVVGPDYNKTLTTDSNGEISISNLKLGDYTITETDVPAKYIQNSAAKVSLTSKKTSVTKKIYNELKDTSGVKIKKVDKDTGDYISGVEMELLLGTTVVEKIKTSDKPYVIKTNLQYGKTYKVCETKAAAGYIKSDDCKSFTVKSEAEKKTIVLTFKNEKTKMSIIKVDDENKSLVGATLQIYKNDGKTVVGEKWVTDGSEHVVEGLTIGEKYILRELEAPEGYIKSADVEFVAKDGISVTMQNMLSQVTVLKVDDSGNGLSGAVLQLYESDGKTPVGNEWTTVAGKLHIIYGLKVNETYIIKEKMAPAGYLKSDDIKFVVGSKNPTNIEIKNIPTEIVITKTDITGKTELAGAHLQIINSDGKIEHEWDSVVGTKKVIKGLNYGETYTLRETVAPEKYAIAEEVVFTVGDNTKVVMKDKLTEVLIYKKDQVTNKVLAGAKLQLIDFEGNIVAEWISTDKPKSVTGLIAGKEYTIKELSSPDKYLKSEDIRFTLSLEDTVKEITVYNAPIIDVPDTDASLSVTSILVGIILILGGAGTILWIKKKNA